MFVCEKDLEVKLSYFPIDVNLSGYMFDQGKPCAKEFKKITQPKCNYIDKIKMESHFFSTLLTQQ